MKPTQVTSAPGGVNQLPPWTEIKGDIRLTPFYDIDQCVEKIKDYVKELNNSNLNCSILLVLSLGPLSSFYTVIEKIREPGDKASILSY